MSYTHASPQTSELQHLTHRLNEVGWALFLILTGALWLLPPDRLPPGAWMLATGILLFGLNVTRWALGLQASPALLVLGSLAGLAGLLALLGLKVSLVAICLIVLGGSMLLRELRRSP